MQGRQRIAAMALAVSAGMAAGCADQPAGPELEAVPPGASSVETEIVRSDRVELLDGIAHYTFDLAVGPGEFDVVRLHRIVRERAPGDPAPTVDGVFLLPGAPNSWVQIFVEPLISEVPPADQSVAIYLAERGIDVWGIDYAWAQVPRATTDFGFMEGWGVQRDVDAARAGLAKARSIRTSTGQGNGRLHLLGFSYGGPVAFGVAGAETRLPPGQRAVKGLVAVDTDVVRRDPAVRAVACKNAAAFEARIASGTYVNDRAAGLIMLAGLAESAPDQPSPVVPTLTNWEFIMNATASGIPHFVGATFDEDGVPTGLRFTDPALWIDVLQATRPYWPLQATADLARARCGTGRDVSFDDDLEDITVPIFYVGAAGGARLVGTYTVEQTATREYTELLVQRLPDGEGAYDFGHADLFTATDADRFVWEPIRQWLEEHREQRTYPGRPTR